MPRKQARPDRKSTGGKRRTGPVRRGFPLKRAALITGATAFLLFGCITIGMALEVRPEEMAPGKLFQRLAPPSPRPVVTAPIAVDLSGYSLDPNKRDRMVYVTIAMMVADDRQEDALCRNMPRLRAAVIQNLGSKLRDEGDTDGAAAPSMVDYARDLVAAAVDTDVGREFGLLIAEDWRQSSSATCPVGPGAEF